MAALVAAASGTLYVPAAVRLAEPVVCGKEARIEYQRVRYPNQESTSSILEVNCVDRAGARRDVLVPAMGTLFVIYLAVLFPALLFWPRSPSSARPRGM
ncbi:hypothetical protein [Longimicrobium sp.]|uniref:hypothetical protein n=1 Tax=Longimicrobium sp. TaxID=2029185 RepID=UPI003B3ACD93